VSPPAKFGALVSIDQGTFLLTASGT